MPDAFRAVLAGPGYIGTVHADAVRRTGVEVLGFVGSGAEVRRNRANELRLGEAIARSARERRWVEPNLDPNLELVPEA